MNFPGKPSYELKMVRDSQKLMNGQQCDQDM